jgi:WD40-like Beta Propeller Repeat
VCRLPFHRAQHQTNRSVLALRNGAQCCACLRELLYSTLRGQICSCIRCKVRLFGQSEIQQFCLASFSDKNVCRFDVAMNDVLCMRYMERIGNLCSEFQHLIDFHRFSADCVLESLYLGRSDGSEIRRLTNDPNKDRHPNWSPNGKDIIFISDRSGQYDFWMIHSDGSGLRKVTETTDAWAPSFSPDGSYLSVSNEHGTFLFDIRKPLPWKNPTPFPAYPDHALRFAGHLWSPDSKKLFGIIVTTDNIGAKAVAQYSFESQQYETSALPYAPDDEGLSWLTPTKMLIVAEDNHLLTLDLPTKKVTEVSLPKGLSVLHARFKETEKALILRSETSESDIWLMKHVPQ